MFNFQTWTPSRRVPHTLKMFVTHFLSCVPYSHHCCSAIVEKRPNSHTMAARNAFHKTSPKIHSIAYMVGIIIFYRGEGHGVYITCPRLPSQWGTELELNTAPSATKYVLSTPENTQVHAPPHVTQWVSIRPACGGESPENELVKSQCSGGMKQARENFQGAYHGIETFTQGWGVEAVGGFSSNMEHVNQSVDFQIGPHQWLCRGRIEGHYEKALVATTRSSQSRKGLSGPWESSGELYN